MSIDYRVTDLVVTVCAIAEFWGCIELIKPRILSALKSSPAYWKYVGEYPKENLVLAAKLEDADIYRDALRHMVAQAHMKQDWKDVVNVTGWTEVELRDFYSPQLEELGPRTRALREKLQKLQLGYVRAKYHGGGWHDSHMRYFDMVHYLSRSEQKVPIRVHWLGGAMFSEVRNLGKTPFHCCQHTNIVCSMFHPTLCLGSSRRALITSQVLQLLRHKLPFLPRPIDRAMYLI
jgi:hypothetical protein